MTNQLRNSITIISFSNKINQHTFNVPSSGLTVPDVLPSHITSTKNMFLDSDKFNQNISNWDTGNIRDMSGMFKNAEEFNQDLSNWPTGSLTKFPEDFATNTPAWSSPKPEGTTPIAPPVVVPPVVVPPVIVPPPVVIPTGSGFTFNVLSPDVNDAETPLIIEMTDTIDDWTLIVDNTTVITRLTNNPHYVVSQTGSIVKLTISGLRNKSVNYKLMTVAKVCTLYNAGRSQRTVKVTEFVGGILQYQFNLADTLLTVPTVLPRHIVNLSRMFDGANLFNQDISMWDTSNVTDMWKTFGGCTSFNKPLNNWNVAKVTRMFAMFSECSLFNQPLNDWNVFNVKALGNMFVGCSSFNQDLSMWDVRDVGTPPPNFDGRTDRWVLPKPIWGTDGTSSSVTPLEFNVTSVATVNTSFTLSARVLLDEWSIYKNDVLVSSASVSSPDIIVAKSVYYKTTTIRMNNPEETSNNYKVYINSHISLAASVSEEKSGLNSFEIISFYDSTYGQTFDVNNIRLTVPTTLPPTRTDLRSMFSGSNLFNQDISGWDMSNVVSIKSMFSGCTSFNINLSKWNTNSVVDMSVVFAGCTSYNQPLNDWDVSNVKDMNSMFLKCTIFNQPLDKWNTSKVTIMYSMFLKAERFNQDISMWDVSNVYAMSGMFEEATDFNQPLNDWDVSKLGSTSTMFKLATSFNQPLNRWNTKSLLGATEMFDSAYAFNQDLSGWCVSNVTSWQQGFGDQAAMQSKHHPKWGTCPEPTPDVVVVPDVEYVTDESMYLFSTSNIRHPSQELPITVYLKDIVGTWSLIDRKNGMVLADDTGIATVDNVRIDESGYTRYIYLKRYGSSDCEYALVGNIGKCIISNTKSTSLKSTGTFTVESFTPMVRTYEYRLSHVDIVVPDTLPSFVTSLSKMFAGCTLFNYDISKWDTSNVTDMSYMVEYCAMFNQDLSGWNTSNVIKMQYMFQKAEIFNQDIGSWNTGNVRDMTGMFYYDAAFNQDLSRWNVSKIPKRPSYFNDVGVWTLPNPVWGTDGKVVPETNGPSPMLFTTTNYLDATTELPLVITLSGDVHDDWTLRDVTEDIIVADDTGSSDVNAILTRDGFGEITVTLSRLGSATRTYEINGIANRITISNNLANPVDPSNPDGSGVIEKFSTSIAGVDLQFENAELTVPEYLPENITTMYYMFAYSRLFNQDISMWDTSHVTDMTSAFRACDSFNMPIGDWDTSSVTSMERMFYLSKSFNQPINNWNTSNVTNMTRVFYDTESFNQPINNWDTSSVTSMEQMFGRTVVFNQNLTGWDTSKVTNMDDMFYRAVVFNGDINTWDTGLVETMDSMFRECAVFNQDISMWDVSKVTSMRYMFRECTQFNQDLSQWCVVGESREPSRFARDANAWVLPQPRWGTCPRGEIIPDRGVVPTPVAPPTPTTPEIITSESFKFTTTNNYADGNMELPITIELIGVSEEWELKENGYVIANNIGSSSVGVVIGVGPTISLQRSDGIYRSLEFVGSALQIKVSNSITSANDIVGDVTVECFSTAITTYRFPLTDITLTVPEGLPPHITDLSYMFAYCNLFNQNINAWDTSRVFDMHGTFKECFVFNQPLSNWDLGYTADVGYMFYDCTLFNQNVNDWNVSNVVDMSNLFYRCTNFDAPLDLWDTSNVTRMYNTLRKCTYFNQDISMWDVSSVTDMDYMFRECTYFNQDLSQWCVGGVASEPSRFSVDCYSWLLPKPVWGTCPRGENTLVPSDLVPVIPPTPAVPAYIESTSFKLSTQNTIGSGRELDIEIWIKTNYSTWSLHEDGVIIADSGNLNLAHGVYYYYDSDVGYAKVKLSRAGSEHRNLELIGDNIDIVWVRYDTIAPYGTKDACVTIDAFSSNVANHRFYIIGASLALPEGLPPYVTTLQRMFLACTDIVSDINAWDVSHVTDMTSAFNGAINFNQPLSNWDVSSVTNMSRMFYDATAFNQVISMWDTSNVTDMSYMFRNAKYFNQDLSTWNVSKIPMEPGEFNIGALSWTLPQPIWGTVGATSLPLGNPFEFTINDTVDSYSPPSAVMFVMMGEKSWSVYENDRLVVDTSGSKVAHIEYTPMGDEGILIQINHLDSKISNYKMYGTVSRLGLGNMSESILPTTNTLVVDSFGDTSDQYAFMVANYKLTVPQTLPTRITNITGMFADSTNFNQDISMWDTSNVTDMSFTFNGCVSFNQPIGNWDVSQVTTMSCMFQGCAKFNQDISNWDTSNVTAMTYMFEKCSTFNQDLSNWPVVNIPTIPYGFATDTVAWTLPKPVWGTDGAPVIEEPVQFLPIDITGASGVYLTLSRNGTDFTTFNLSDPEFDMMTFSKFVSIGDDNNSVAFAGWPEILPAESILPTDQFGICGLMENGNVATPRHDSGYYPINGIWISETEGALPPLTITQTTNVIIAKATPDIPTEYDIYYSLPGATTGDNVTVTSHATIAFDENEGSGSGINCDGATNVMKFDIEPELPLAYKMTINDVVYDNVTTRDSGSLITVGNHTFMFTASNNRPYPVTFTLQSSTDTLPLRVKLEKVKPTDYALNVFGIHLDTNPTMVWDEVNSYLTACLTL